MSRIAWAPFCGGVLPECLAMTLGQLSNPTPKCHVLCAARWERRNGSKLIIVNDVRLCLYLVFLFDIRTTSSFFQTVVKNPTLLT